MPTCSLDRRERIVASYDEGKEPRAEVARRFRISEGMVKKLLCQRKRLQGDLRAQHHLAGRKPKILPEHREAMAAALEKKPDLTLAELTLAELRAAVKLSCTLPAIHYALRALRFSYKKKRSVPASRTAPTSPEPARSGKRGRPGSIPSG